jgi:hypothetical protein
MWSATKSYFMVTAPATQNILINDNKLLISSSTSTAAIVRHPKSSGPVENDEPIVVLFAIGKVRSQMFTLSNYLAPLIAR